jgi:hypothetical protein
MSTLSCTRVEDLMMASVQSDAGSGKTPRQTPTSKKPVGRPKGEPSTIVNVRLPLALLARLDRYLDRLEVQTGRKANRGMITRRALAFFLETQESRTTRGS